MKDTIYRQDAIDTFLTIGNICVYGEGVCKAVVSRIEQLPSAESKRLSNKEWVDLLAEQFDVSRTSAKEMLHGMMRCKALDNFKKQFSGRDN